MIKSVIFDCFGVLTEDGWLAFCGKYKTAENEEELAYINHQADRGMMPYEEFLQKACELTGASKQEAHTTITTSHHPNKQLFEFIKKLKSANYVLGVISNVGDELNNFLPQDCVDLFDDITLSYSVKALKPEPEIYEYHLNKIGFKPEETVFIDDRDYNVEGAKNIGMHSFMYTTMEQLMIDLESLDVTIK